MGKKSLLPTFFFFSPSWNPLGAAGQSLLGQSAKEVATKAPVRGQQGTRRSIKAPGFRRRRRRIIGRMGLLRIHRLLFGVSVVCLQTSVSLADRMVLHSFEGPYEHVDPSGAKSVSKDWKPGGVTTVNKNFVRLTPDRQVRPNFACMGFTVPLTHHI